MRSSQREFKSRWPDLARGALRNRLLAPPCKSDFGMTDENLCDFRGVNISESLHGVEVVDADFSFGEMFTGQLVGSFANCRFRGCRYEGCVSKRFGKCDFSAANLTRCVLDGEFEDCSFIGTNFNHARGAQLRFTSCAFAKASFRGSAFYDAIFRRCSFEACEFN